MSNEELIAKAYAAREKAYAPYSGFAVGAALLCADGTVFTGCNVENAAYSVGICAERTALCKAVSEGRTDFIRIAVVGGKAGQEATEYCAPCGLCRQALAEFCGNDFEVLLPAVGKETKRFTFAQLLPEAFGPGNLK